MRLVLKLQHRLDTERASARAKERHLTENLHSFQQVGGIDVGEEILSNIALARS